MDTTTGSLDKAVAIVTGAGGGIGRAFALELGRLGVAVVVNDYGGDRNGGAGNIDRAEAVASEIRAAGGKAIADATAIGSWQSGRDVVAKAVQAYGRLDILVNNAGIALPGYITDHSDEAIDRVLETNLHGPYALMRAAWPVMREQRYGRVINVSSSAALGVGGNAVYGCTKAGLLGLTFDTAIEGAPIGIKVNAILPTAHTRLTSDLPDAAFSEWLKRYFQPEKIAAAAAVLLGPQCPDSGKIYSIGAGRMAQVELRVARGFVDVSATPGAIDFAQVHDMQQASPLASSADDIRAYMPFFPWVKEGGSIDMNIDSVAAHAASVAAPADKPASKPAH